MENLKLESVGIEELSSEELQESNGGSLLGAILGFIGGVVEYESHQAAREHRQAVAAGFGSSSKM